MPSKPLGSAATWARDFAILGLLSSLIIPISSVALAAGPAHLGQAMDEMARYFVVVAPLGALSGLAFGALLRGVLLRLPAVPLGALLLIVPILAAVWGATIAWGMAPLASVGYAGENDKLAVILGASTAALQVAWFWPLYLRRRVNNRSPASLFGAAAISGVVIGPVVTWFV